MLPHRVISCAGASLVYVMLCLALSVLGWEGNNLCKDFSECY